MFINKAKHINTLINVEDKSKYKVHENLAKDIFSYIKESHKKSHNNEKVLPQIIGLEGPWGSGKSNLIQLIKKEITNSRKSKNDSSFSCHDFIFNIWENQGDSIENTFLKYLLDDLISNKILVGKTSIKTKGIQRREKWVDIFDIFTAKKQHEKSFLWGFVVIFTLLLTSFIKWFNFSDVSWQSISNFSFLFVVCFVLFLVFFSSKKFTNPFHIFPVKSTYSEISSVGIYTEDFRNLFTNISNELQKQNKILIINFDNIDRCSNKKIQEVLSIICSIFSEHVYKNIWVILTYDYDKISEAIWSQQHEDAFSCQNNSSQNTKLFDDTKETIQDNNVISDTEENVEEIRAFKKNNENDVQKQDKNREIQFNYYIQKEVKDDYVHGVLFKILPIIYRVPTPIILDYQSIFRLYFIEAFGDNKSGDEKTVENYIFKIYRTKNQDLIYRNIISFINQLVTIYNRPFVKDISLFSIAVYVLYKKDILQAANVLSFVFPWSIDEARKELKISEETLKGEISSLLYQIAKTEAIQMQIINNINTEIKRLELEIQKVSKNLRTLFDSTNIWQNPFFFDGLSFSDKFFKFINYSSYLSSWNYIFEYLPKDFMFQRIFNIYDKYISNENFVKLMESIAQDKAKQLDEKGNISNFSWQEYFVLFSSLKNQKLIEELKQSYLQEMSFFLKDNTDNTDNTDEIYSFCLLSLFLCREALKRNPNITFEKNAQSLQFMPGINSILSNFENRIGEILFYLITEKKYNLNITWKKRFSFLKERTYIEWLAENTKILGIYEIRKFHQYLVSFFQKSLFWEGNIKAICKEQTIFIFDFIELLSYKDFSDFSKKLYQLYQKLIKDKIQNNAVQDQGIIEERKQKAEDYDQKDIIQILCYLLRFIRQSSWGNQLNTNNLSDWKLINILENNEITVINLIKSCISDCCFDEDAYDTEPFPKKAPPNDIVYVYADVIVYYFMYCSKNKLIKSPQSLLLSSFIEDYEYYSSLPRMMLEIKKILSSNFYGDADRRMQNILNDPTLTLNSNHNLLGKIKKLLINQ